MRITSKLRQAANGLLERFGLRIESLAGERRGKQILLELIEMKYFESPAFPLPECVKKSRWNDVVSWIEYYRADFQQLIIKNSVDFCNANGYFSSPDSDVLYCLIRKLAPKKYVEIGSGNSTRLVRQAVIDGKLSTEIVSIDPQPRAEVARYADRTYSVRVETLDADQLASEFGEGDFLFIDSSHIASIGSDCTYEFLQLLPRLPSGVVVHVHDVSLPWDYPLCWKESGRSMPWSWNEQYLLQAMLMGNAKLDVIWPGYLLQRTQPASELHKWFPSKLPGRDATSFWFIVR